ncbi:hypothetical protein M408DRAFT_137475 [Serendipita vermifera MAFF 305830]|uniref:Uncharacterized protein n=1 Tax=Serendipita vermifera MAFF 305830 TaxID=933852 RepID=A0A0C2XHS5_SERVB|nr:hypothetical protein M408DRAFT_137475 [Serendipita vermifera MAFF 305830]
MGFKTNSTIMSNSAIVRYDPTSAWDSYTTHTSNSNVSLDFYGTDITAYGTGYAHAYQIFLDERQISDYAQRHFNNSEVADYYRCTTDNPSDGFCVALLELRGLDPTTRHTIKIRSIVTGDEYIQALQWLVQYDTGIDDSASTAHLTNLWPSEGSITYSGSWGTLVGGDKVTHTPGDTSKFTFTGSGIQIFAMAAPGTRLRIELDGDAQEIAPTETRSAEIIAYEYPTLYSRLGLDKSVPHNVTITNIVDASNANPLVNVTFKQMVIWKDG